MTTGGDFHDDCRDFHEDSPRLQTVKILMMIGPDFHDDRSRFYYKRLRFSWWQVESLLQTVKIFMMTGWEFITNG